MAKLKNNSNNCRRDTVFRGTFSNCTYTTSHFVYILLKELSLYMLVTFLFVFLKQDLICFTLSSYNLLKLVVSLLFSFVMDLSATRQVWCRHNTSFFVWFRFHISCLWRVCHLMLELWLLSMHVKCVYTTCNTIWQLIADLYSINLYYYCI